MENPPSSPDSPQETLNEPAAAETPLGLSEEVKPNESRPKVKHSEERRSQTLDEETKDHALGSPSVKFSKPHIVIEPPKESRPPHLSEQAKDGEPQDHPAEDHVVQRPQDSNQPHEDSQRPDLDQVALDSAAEDLKSEAEAPGDAPQETLLDKESPPPSTTDDTIVLKPSVDHAQKLPEPAPEQPPQALRAPIPVASIVGGPEPRPLEKKGSPSRIFATGTSRKSTKKALVEERPGSCCRSCGRSSVKAATTYTWRPPASALPSLRTKPKPQMVDKSTQIFPGRVQMFPKRVLPPKPKPPSANKGTQISPSFEKLLRRPPPLIKKKRKEEMSPMTLARAPPRVTSLQNRQQTLSRQRSRSPPARAKRPSLQVKSSKIRPRPLGAKSSKIRPRPLGVKSSRGRPLRVKSSKSMPLRVKMSSTSPSKHRLNLSLCSRKKQKIICNLYLTFCDHFDETAESNVQETHWEESLYSCSGLYRACSVFSMVRYGRIHVNNLLLALHTLGVLVTSEEMHYILRLVNVDQHESLNFCEFLEAVKTASPFAETEAFQDTLRAFRKMKKGTVTAKELEPILQYLGVTLSPETIQQALGQTKVNKNGTFDISDFLLAVKELQRILEEEEEAYLNERSVSKRRPFQDVADLVDAENRRRRKYWDCFEEESAMPTSLLPRLPTSVEDAALNKQLSRTSNVALRRSSSSSPANRTKEEAKDGEAVKKATSQMDPSSDLRSSALENPVEPPNQNATSPIPA
ncbi:uncharacterized protein LOC143825078 [Paroedura picta]|uniref:uncharacterized protein LOC143825078 n=1 Tax=Paroedura picta TaxID=143630 RepID=UPI0040576847